LLSSVTAWISAVSARRTTVSTATHDASRIRVSSYPRLRQDTGTPLPILLIHALALARSYVDVGTPCETRRGVLRAIALIIDAGSPAFDCAYQILSCPAAPEHEGGTFTAPREVRSWRVGQHAVVKFCPDDQFAYECKEALEP